MTSGGRGDGATVLDNAFTDLRRDEDGLARVELRDPPTQGGRTVVNEAYEYLMVFTGDPLPDVNRRSLAVEPMTCPPNAFRTGDSLIRLEPGASVTTTWGIARFTLDDAGDKSEVVRASVQQAEAPRSR